MGGVGDAVQDIDALDGVTEGHGLQQHGRLRNRQVQQVEPGVAGGRRPGTRAIHGDVQHLAGEGYLGQHARRQEPACIHDREALGTLGDGNESRFWRSGEAERSQAQCAAIACHGSDDACRQGQSAGRVKALFEFDQVADPVLVGIRLCDVGADGEFRVVGQAVAVAVGRRTGAEDRHRQIGEFTR